jgi:hypothetical protein
MGDVILLVIKLVITIALLPFVIPLVTHFNLQLAEYPASFQQDFLLGGICFLIIFLFINHLYEVFEFGQKAILSLFAFVAPFDKFLANIVPFYMPIIFVIFYITKNFIKITDTNATYVFLIGFSFALHIICSAQDLQNQEKTIFKPTYLFKMMFVIIFNVYLLFLLLDLCFDKSTVGAYLSVAWGDTKDIYAMLYKRLMFIK